MINPTLFKKTVPSYWKLINEENGILTYLNRGKTRQMRIHFCPEGGYVRESFANY